ncbi:outer membrane protein [Pseudoduganella lurida]|uniref:Outer membrane protein n=1 Tax=Pseudoduganella lurida TaxID=1036180 RepID=A0A562RES2_9BURK|nr:MipA/OmpV family protein [Pseudoduganella lurida]TWI67413.1 outer membrane protein [Pseudoduganella lurida]
MKPVLPALLISFLASHHAMAQQQQQQRWGLGLGAAVSDSVYAGEGTRVRAVPLLTYEGERFFWRGIGGGAHLLRQGGLSLDATLSARFDGIDRKDFGTAELARRGVDRALVDDRDDGLDLGLAASWRGAYGQIEVAVKGDVTSASKGYEAGLRYAYPLQFGGTRITPNAGVSHLSKKLANYYYGTLAAEAARGVPDYGPGGATVPRIGIDVFHPFAGRWAVIGNVSYRRLPDRLQDSPLVEEGKDGAASAFIGVARQF